MAELTSGVSWIAVIVGAVAAFLAGWLWYSPMLFGKQWASGVGVELSSADKMPVNAMATQAIGLLLMSWFVGVTAASNALLTVILATLAFAVLGYSGAMFSRRPVGVGLIDFGYLVVALVVMIISQAIF